jgi:predicted O-methyltransferase YrrM
MGGAAIGALTDETRRSAAALVWFLRRPRLYREMLRRVLRRSRLGRGSDAQRQQERERATLWCASVQTDMPTLAAVLGIPPSPEPIRALHPDAWNAALRAQDACPVKMGGPGHVDLIYHVCRALRPTIAVETGVAFGWSTLALLLAMQENGQGRLYSVDMPYKNRGNEDWVGCVVPTDLRATWTLIREPDRDALPPLLKSIEQIDFAHYDSDKSYRGRLFAYAQLYRHLGPGGVLMSDDINDNGAFRDFTLEHGLQPLVLQRPDGRYVGLLRKPAHRES